jgi:hypothetical protein
VQATRSEFRSLGAGVLVLGLIMILSPLAVVNHATPVTRPALERPAADSPTAGATAGITHPTVLLGTTSPGPASSPPRSAAAPRPQSSNGLGVAVGTHFPGISSTNSSCGCAPPDVQVAVGGSQVVEMVNLEGKIWTKGGAVVSSFMLSSFFITGTDFISDPKVLYDNLSGRWFASILDVTNSSIHVAVSKNGSAAGSWVVYFIGGSPAGDFPDQPILGVSTNLVVLGGNQYVITTGAFVGGELWALNKSSMLTGSTTYATVFGPHAAWFSMHPVHSISAAPKEYVVMTTGSSTVDLFSVTGKPSATTSAHLSGATALSVASFAVPPAAPQKGTPKKVDTSDNRVQDAVWRNNTLWLTFDTGCKPFGDPTTRSCVRLDQLSTLGTPSVVQDFNLAIAKVYVFYGALALDKSLNVVVAFGYSNSTMFPAFAVTAHLAGSVVGSLLSVVTLVKGTAAATVACNTHSVCRWGDYYGAGSDPLSPKVWVAGEYVTPTTHWSTWVAQVRA